VIIVVSEGGPPVVHSIVSQLPDTFPTPLVICQAFESDAIGGLVNAWDKTSQLCFKHLSGSLPLSAGVAYVVAYDCDARVDGGSTPPRLRTRRCGSNAEGNELPAALLMTAARVYRESVRIVLVGDTKVPSPGLVKGMFAVIGNGGTICCTAERRDAAVHCSRLFAEAGIEMSFADVDRVLALIGAETRSGTGKGQAIKSLQL
jgi:hypothetical protein